MMNLSANEPTTFNGKRLPDGWDVNNYTFAMSPEQWSQAIRLRMAVRELINEDADPEKIKEAYVLALLHSCDANFASLNLSLDTTKTFEIRTATYGDVIRATYDGSYVHLSSEKEQVEIIEKVVSVVKPVINDEDSFYEFINRLFGSELFQYFNVSTDGLDINERLIASHGFDDDEVQAIVLIIRSIISMSVESGKFELWSEYSRVKDGDLTLLTSDLGEVVDAVGTERTLEYLNVIHERVQYNSELLQIGIDNPLADPRLIALDLNNSTDELERQFSVWLKAERQKTLKKNTVPQITQDTLTRWEEGCLLPINDLQLWQELTGVKFTQEEIVNLTLKKVFPSQSNDYKDAFNTARLNIKKLMNGTTIGALNQAAENIAKEAKREAAKAKRKAAKNS